MGHFSLHGAADFTVRASIANGLGTAERTACPVMGAVELLLRDGQAEPICEMKLNGGTGIADARLSSHPALKPFFRQMISLSVFYKLCPCFKETERDLKGFTLGPEVFDPGVVTGTRTCVVFPAADNLFDLSLLQIVTQGDGPQERRAEDTLVTEGEGEQKRNPFLRSGLVLTSHMKKYVFPAVAPVFRQTGGYSLGTLG